MASKTRTTHRLSGEAMIAVAKTIRIVFEKMLSVSGQTLFGQNNGSAIRGLEYDK